MSYNFLLASWGGPGNLGPMLTAARLLGRRGHAVRVVAMAAQAQLVRVVEARRPHRTGIRQWRTGAGSPIAGNLRPSDDRSPANSRTAEPMPR